MTAATQVLGQVTPCCWRCRPGWPMPRLLSALRCLPSCPVNGAIPQPGWRHMQSIWPFTMCRSGDRPGFRAMPVVAPARWSRSTMRPVRGGCSACLDSLVFPRRSGGRSATASLSSTAAHSWCACLGLIAAAPRQEFLKDWAADDRTAVEADLHGTAQHGPAPETVAHSGPWENRVIGIASEWSPQYPGYLAGAVDAANAGALRALSLARG